MATSSLPSRENPRKINPLSLPAQRTSLRLFLLLWLLLTLAVAVDYAQNHWRHSLWFDQMIFEQAVRSAWRGEGLYAPLEAIQVGYPLRSHNAVHFEPVLYALAPLVALLPGTATLGLVEILLTLSACLPLFLCARLLFGCGWVALPWGLLLAVDRPLQMQLHTDFHAINGAAALYAWALYGVLARKPWLAISCASIGLLFRETETLTLAAFSVFLLLHDRRWWRPALAGLVLAIAWYGLAFHWVIPAAAEGRDYYFYGEKYGHLGDGLFSIALSPVLRPQVFWPFLANPLNQRFLWEHLWYLAFLPLGAPLWLLPALPTVAALLLSQLSVVREVGLHYMPAVLPFLLVAAMRAVSATSRLLPERQRRLPGAAVGVALLGLGLYQSVLGDPVLLYRLSRKTPPRPDIRREAQAVAATLPAASRLAADRMVFPAFLATHPETTLFPFMDASTDYAVTYLGSGTPQEQDSIEYLLSRGLFPLDPWWREHILVFALKGGGSSSFAEELRQLTLNGVRPTRHLPEWYMRLLRGVERPGYESAWLFDPQSRVLLGAPPAHEPGALRLRVRARTVRSYLPHERWGVLLNGTELGRTAPVGMDVNVSLSLPEEAVRGDVNWLTFQNEVRLPGAALGRRQDGREFAAELYELRWE